MTRLHSSAPLLAAVVTAGVLAPGQALAQWTFQNEGTYEACGTRFMWDFAYLEGDTNGRVLDGTCDAFDGCMELVVDGVPFPSTSYSPAYDGQGFSTDTEAVSGVNVARLVYVPSEGRSFARWVDVFENPSGERMEVDVRYRCNLGSDGEERGWGADGDAIPEATDTWIASDDADGLDDPSLAFLVQGVDADIGLRRWVSVPGSGSVDFEYVLPLDPASFRAILVFVVQASDREASYDTATFLEALGPEAMALLDREVELIANFAAGGTPSLRFAGPYLVAEGTAVELSAVYYDADGDEVEVTWDLDGDGEYDDAEGDRVELDATRIDGPVELAVGVRAFDGEHVVTRRGTVEVANEPPALAEPPDPEAVVGNQWIARIAPLVVDPCPQDEVTLDLVRGPDGLEMDAEGTLTWTPLETDVGEHGIRVRLTDDDGGERVVRFPVEVRTNVPPAPPRLVSPQEGEVVGVTRPTLVVGNSTDPDRDVVRYEMRVDWVPPADAGAEACEGGAEEVVSAPLDGDPSGNTSWQVTQRLCKGQAYRWRARATDGYEPSQWIERAFAVDRDAVDEEGGPDGGDEPSAGCACRTGGSGRVGAAVLTAAWYFLVRRRVRR